MKWIVMILALVVAVAVGTFWYDAYSAKSALLEQPIYRVLKKHEPAVYEKVLAEYKHFANDETARESFVNFANSEISLAATRNLAHGSQESVLALMKDMVATATALRAKSPESCFRYWFPQVSGPPDVARYVDPAAQAHTLELMSEVIRTSAESPTPLPQADAVKANLANVVNATYQQYGSDAQLIAHAEEPNVDRAKVCVITISVYQRILKLSPADSSALIRAMTQVR
jgi:vacuolar-type H+-ATPase subunit C/Vma6